MTSPARYAGLAALLVAAAVAGLWPWLQPAGRQGVLLAGGVALGVQLPALWLLLRSSPERFLGPWAAGMGLRLLAVAGVTMAAVRWDAFALVPALLAVGGFFYALLMLEAVAVWRRRPSGEG